MTAVIAVVAGGTFIGLTATSGASDPQLDRIDTNAYKVCVRSGAVGCVAPPVVTPPTTAPPTTTPPTTTPPTVPPSTKPAASGSFPGAGNTGIPAGTVLTTYTGSRTITKAGTVISGAKFLPGSQIYISAPNVVIKNSLIQTQDTYDITVDPDVANASVSVIDSEFAAQPTAFQGEEMAIHGQHWTLTRVNIHGYRDAGGIDGWNTITDSWMHDFRNSSACEHADGLQGLGNVSYVLIRHNTIDMSLTNCMAGLIQLGNEYGGNHDVTVQNNWLAGGSFMFYASMSPTDSPSYNIQFTGNTLSKKYFPNYGSYGIVNYWVPSTPGAVWSGNVDADTGKTIAPPS